MYRSIISLSKITHQPWHDQPFNQRNKATKRALGEDVGGKEEGGGLEFEKGGQYRGD